ncbi:MAG TPA: hypothetical protein VFS05_14005 [Gemmatimonadaceae bacterium]|nr:hypothetical protein [Gemmatimonadaceae bacterium]
MPRASRTPDVGSPAPRFSLAEATSGRTIDLESLLIGRRALLLVFHRGMW